MTLRMLWLLLFMSISSFFVSPFSASRAIAGVAISPYLEGILIDLNIRININKNININASNAMAG